MEKKHGASLSGEKSLHITDPSELIICLLFGISAVCSL